MPTGIGNVAGGPGGGYGCHILCRLVNFWVPIEISLLLDHRGCEMSNKWQRMTGREKLV